MKNKIIYERTSEFQIQLPGLNHQVEHLFSEHSFKGDRALIIGNIHQNVVSKLLTAFNQLNIIVNSYDSLMKQRFLSKENDSVKIKMMDYTNTDFDNKYFSLIYAQGSVSISDRKNIVKEIKRIITDDGLLSIGEIVSLKEPVANFVNDIWEQSGLNPWLASSIKNFYENKGFIIISEKDLSHTMNDFYEKLRYRVSKADKNEKEQNKKYFSRIKHESNVYLKLGGDKYIGFKSLIMREQN